MKTVIMKCRRIISLIVVLSLVLCTSLTVNVMPVSANTLFANAIDARVVQENEV